VLSNYNKASMKRKYLISFFILSWVLLINHGCNSANKAELILINGKIVTVDKNFTISEAVAVLNDKIEAVGTNNQIRRYAGRKTKIIDLKGKTVIPGLIDSHLHPESASLSELEEEIPDVHNMDQLLTWIKDQTKIKEKGKWIIFPKFFSTRIIEMRQPTLAELDLITPDHPVFLNGSFGGMINSVAMKLSGINKKTDHPGILKDKITGLPTGFIRASAFNLLKVPSKKSLSYQEKQDALVEMLKRYNQFGITSLFSGTGDFESVKMYRDMSDKKILTARIYQNILLQTNGKITKESVKSVVKNYEGTTGSGNEWVRIGSLKVFLDGGILTGTAYLQEPWGDKAREIFGIEDPAYRGVVNFSREELVAIVSVANEFNWSFTAHATGGGSVDLLLDVYSEVNRSKSIKEKRFSIIHGNFFSNESIKKMSELGVYANIQPAWFYKDADAMEYILGKNRIKTFHPNKSMLDAGVMINGGSDHMVKWDANSSINPYNPFLAMWTMITRGTERGSVIGSSEAISREDALRIYTINNAFASFEESIKGSLEPGKLADMAILTEDILTCPVDRIKEIESVITIVGGKVVYASGIQF
jgi:predicted amidohydrolase YtcJ